MAPYALTNDTRPRAAAKELVEILAGHGIKFNLRKARETVAVMYGYEGWKHLLDNLGGQASADDAAVDSVTAMQRHATQAGALLSAGVPPGLVEAIRVSLGITARTGKENLREIGLVDLRHMYHPFRYEDAVISKERYDDSVQKYRAGAYSSDNMEDWPQFAIDVDIQEVDENEVVGHLLEYSEEVSFLSMDVDFLNAFREPFFGFWGGVSTDVFDSDTLIDASRMPDDIDVEGVFDVKSVDETHYVHLGINRHPSPYFGLGIEGMYIRAGHMVDEFDTLEIGLVVSPDYTVGGEFAEEGMHVSDPYRWMAENHRVAWLHAHVREDGTLGDWQVKEGTEDPNGIYSRFIAYAPAAVRQAMAAVQRRQANAPEFIDCIDAESSAEEVARFRRARTPAQRERVLEEFRESGAEFGVIGSWGGSPGNIDSVPEPGPHLNQSIDDLDEHLAVYMHRALGEYGYHRLHFSRMASKVIDRQEANGEEVRSAADIVRLCLVRGYDETDDYAKAVEAVLPMLDDERHPLAYSIVQIAMSASVQADDRDAVTRVLDFADRINARHDDIRSEDCDGAYWAALLGHAYMGSYEAFERSGVALQANPHVVDELVSGDSRGLFSPDSIPLSGSQASADSIGGYQYHAWQKIWDRVSALVTGKTTDPVKGF